MMRNALPVAEIGLVVKRVQRLDDDCLRDLLFGLIGRLSVSDGEALIAEVELAEAQHESQLREDDEHRSPFPPTTPTAIAVRGRK